MAEMTWPEIKKAAEEKAIERNASENLRITSEHGAPIIEAFLEKQKAGKNGTEDTNESD